MTSLFFLTPVIVLADIGPKPSVDIQVTLGGQNISDSSFKAKMLTCQEEKNQLPNQDLIPQLNISEYDSLNNCYWQPAELVWGGDCEDSHCHFNYFLPLGFRLAVYLPSQDKVYLSSEMTRKNFRSTFLADLLSDGSINLKETTPLVQSDLAKFIVNFFFALILTLILELLVALVYVSRTKISKKILLSVLIANIISLPFFWFVFLSLKIIPSSILLGEIFVFIFEGCFIYWLNKEIISRKKSFILSLLMNLASLVIGGVIFTFLSMMLYS